jgi:hypothetical protein
MPIMEGEIHGEDSGGEAERFWEGSYRGRPERPWDGGANPVLIGVVGAAAGGERSGPGLRRRERRALAGAARVGG